MTAAGGIVIRGGRRPLFAVVQRRKDDCWVLPKGKLKRGEKPAAAAKREAVEETGHSVRLHEFLGAIVSGVGGKQKLTSFWRMQAAHDPRHDLADDIKTVAWLPLASAVARLSQTVERTFLDHVGRHALKLARAAGNARGNSGSRPRKRAAASCDATTRAQTKHKTKHGKKSPCRMQLRVSDLGVSDLGVTVANVPSTARQRGKKNVLRRFLGKLRHNAALT